MIVDYLKTSLIDNIKAKDLLKVNVLRFLISAVKNKEIELRAQHIDLNDEQVIKVINKQIKMRNDSIEAYKSGNRQDLVDKETAERQVLEEILSQVSNVK